VLGVDRQQEASAPLPGLEGEVAGGDEALLVRKGERDSAIERPERGVDAGEADDRVQHDVRLRPLQQLGQVASDLGVRDAVLGREGGEIRRPGRERAELELRVPLHDFDRL
jgi:hypothetical protein